MTMSDKYVSRSILRLVICDTHDTYIHLKLKNCRAVQCITLSDHCGQTNPLPPAPFHVASTFPPFRAASQDIDESKVEKRRQGKEGRALATMSLPDPVAVTSGSDQVPPGR